MVFLALALVIAAVAIGHSMVTAAGISAIPGILSLGITITAALGLLK